MGPTGLDRDQQKPGNQTQTSKSPDRPSEPKQQTPQTRQEISSHTNAWGDSADPHHAQLHQGPARHATVVTQSSDVYPGSIDGASNVSRRSNIRPSMAAARSASDRDIRRRRVQTGDMRGPESSTGPDRHYPNINFSELQNDLSRITVPQNGALLTVMHVTANDLADSQATVPEVPASPPISQEIPRLKLPDHGFRASLRKLSSSERSHIKSRLLKRKPHGRIDENLLFANKYPDPRSKDFRRDPEESSPSEDSSPSEELHHPRRTTTLSHHPQVSRLHRKVPRMMARMLSASVDAPTRRRSPTCMDGTRVRGSTAKQKPGPNRFADVSAELR